MEKLMKEYILELRTMGRNSSNPYLSLKLFLEYLKSRELDLLSVRLKDAEDFQIYLSTMENKERLRYGKKTVINIVGNVRMFYASLKRKNIASVNPFNGITRIRANKELPKDIPREEELEKLLESLRDFGREIILLNGGLLQGACDCRANILQDENERAGIAQG